VKTGRFFVTLVLILVTGIIISCRGRKNDKMEEGKQDLVRARFIGHELARAPYFMRVSWEETKDQYGQKISTQTLAQDYNWRRLNHSQRYELKKMLAEYIELLNRIMRTDAEKGIYVDGLDLIIASRDAAYAYQQSLEACEKSETCKPVNSTDPQPIYNQAFEASYKSSH
jgi:hypothetical protein